jgi:hypothetical protein
VGDSFHARSEWRQDIDLDSPSIDQCSRPRGAFNIPRDGAVIFVIGPHHNQVPRSHFVVMGMNNDLTHIPSIVPGSRCYGIRGPERNETESGIYYSCESE